MADKTPGIGDILVIEKANGHCDVKEMLPTGEWGYFREGDVGDLKSAMEIARVRLEHVNGRNVWYRFESEPDTEMVPFKRRS